MKNKYDVIIVGAGIGGLTCGCYLTQKGLSVLIVERGAKPGGYCVSFRRNNFLFDAGPHSLGSCRKTGQLGKLFKDLNLGSKIRLYRKDPADIVIVPGHKISFFNDVKKTKNCLIEEFNKEAENIERFFDFLNISNIGFLYSKLKNFTFKQLLDNYFDDNALKTVFGLVV